MESINSARNAIVLRGLNKLRFRTWLEDLVSQFCYYVGHEVRVRVREERHRGHQRPAVVVDHVFAQFLRQLAQYALLVEEFTLVSMLEILGYTLPHFPGQFPVSHVLFHLFHLK